MTIKHNPPGRLGPIFDACRAEGRAALIGYLPTGYPDVPISIEAMVAMCESRCDIIEVGVPYSDPGMDGPVIATATESALQAGVRVSDTLRAVEAISAARPSARHASKIEANRPVGLCWTVMTAPAWRRRTARTTGRRSPRPCHRGRTG